LPPGHTDAAHGGIVVRPLQESDLREAEKICRAAFGTIRRVRDVETYWIDREYAWSRWHAEPTCAFAADFEGRLAGTNFGVCWGSVGFLGPLTIRPDLWDKGIGRHLVGPVVERLNVLGARHIGLFTFAESGKHVNLYQKFDFWPRFLTAFMSAPVINSQAQPTSCRYSEIPESERAHWLDMCQALTDELHEGLDLRSAIRAVQAQRVGETVFVWQGSRLAGFAICRYGPKSEAGAGVCLIKFGAVRPGPSASQFLDQLLAACKLLAAEVGLSRLLLGVNTSRHQAYRHLLGCGFRTELQGITMHRPNEDGYNRDDAYVLDDWR
jgi:GNAT superfamily N-acetyltransferase